MAKQANTKIIIIVLCFPIFWSSCKSIFNNQGNEKSSNTITENLDINSVEGICFRDIQNFKEKYHEDILKYKYTKEFDSTIRAILPCFVNYNFSSIQEIFPVFKISCDNRDSCYFQIIMISEADSNDVRSCNHHYLYTFFFKDSIYVNSSFASRINGILSH